MSKKPEPMLFADSNRGVYIPQYFAQTVRQELVSGIDTLTWAVLESGPDAEDYWDRWSYALDNATVSADGTEWRLYQDQDLWLIPEDMPWDDEADFYRWPE